jgi:hypothetical protein
VTGNHPRTIIMTTAPFSALSIVQAIHRGWRATTKSDLRVHYIRLDHPVDDWIINISIQKMATLGAVVHGEVEEMAPDEGIEDEPEIKPESKPETGGGAESNLSKAARAILESEWAPGVPITFASLRRKLPDIPHDEFDRLMQQLAEAQAIVARLHDHAGGLTPEQRRDLVKFSNDPFPRWVGAKIANRELLERIARGESVFPPGTKGPAATGSKPPLSRLAQVMLEMEEVPHLPMSFGELRAAVPEIPWEEFDKLVGQLVNMQLINIIHHDHPGGLTPKQQKESGLVKLEGDPYPSWVAAKIRDRDTLRLVAEGKLEEAQARAPKLQKPKESPEVSVAKAVMANTVRGEDHASFGRLRMQAPHLSYEEIEKVLVDWANRRIIRPIASEEYVVAQMAPEERRKNYFGYPDDPYPKYGAFQILNFRAIERLAFGPPAAAPVRKATLGDVVSIPQAASFSMESWKDWLEHAHPEIKENPTKVYLTRGDIKAEYQKMIEEYSASMLEGARMGPPPWFPYPSKEEWLKDLEFVRGPKIKPMPFAAPTSGLGKSIVANATRFLATKIVPTVAEAADALNQVKRDFYRIWAPYRLDDWGPIGARALRYRMAQVARRLDQVSAALEGARRMFDKMPQAQVVDFIDRLEHGREQPNEDLQKIADIMRDALDDARRAVQALGKGKLQKYYENYFPHIWKDRRKAEIIAAHFFGRRPLEGPKSFLKKRKYLYFKEGLDNGLKPISWNPVDLVLMKLSEVGRYVMAHRFMNSMKSSHGVVFVPVNGRPPAGWRKIIDPIGTVYGDPNILIRELPNEQLWDALHKVLSDLGIRHERGQRRPARVWKRAAGRAHPDARYIETAGGSAEQVISHELGHMLDLLEIKDDQGATIREVLFEYPGGPLGRRISQAIREKRSSSKDIRKAAREFLRNHALLLIKRKQIKEELKNLADQRQGGSERYRHSVAEKIAAVFEAWVGARELLERVAPTAKQATADWMRRIPELAPLLNIEGGLELKPLYEKMNVGGLVIKGYYYAPQSVAIMLENYLKEGLRGSIIFRGAMAVNNSMNMFQLSLSAFHLMNTALDAMNSALGLAVYDLSRGNVAKALRRALLFPVAPFSYAIEGDKLLKAWKAPGDPKRGSMVDMMLLAGGRAKMSDLYKTHFKRKFVEAISRLNIPMAVAVMPSAIIEAFSDFTMEYVVPRMKLGAFTHALKAKLAYMKNPNRAEIAAAASEAWDVVEDRLGEVVYDNYFWNRYAKDMAHLVVRSVGWNLGSLRVLFRGATEAGESALRAVRGKAPDVTLAASYLIALPVFTALVGAVLMKLLTGRWPERLEDYFFPQTGDIDEYGRPRRVSLPTYVKDMFHFAREPLKTLANKASPLVDLAADMLQNRDFYGVKIRNEFDPIVEQVKQVAERVIEQYLPFGVREAVRAAEEQATPRHIFLPFFGMVPAPAVLSRTPAERLAQEFIAQRSPVGGRGILQAERSRGIRALSRSIRLGKEPGPITREAARSGYITAEDIRRAIKEAGMTPLEVAFQQLSLEEALRVWEVASQDERRLLAPYLLRKIRSMGKLPPAQGKQIIDIIRGITP